MRAQCSIFLLTYFHTQINRNRNSQKLKLIDYQNFGNIRTINNAYTA